MPLSESKATRRAARGARGRTTITTKGLLVSFEPILHTFNYAKVESVEIPSTVLTSTSQMVSSEAESSSGIDIRDIVEIEESRYGK